RQQMVAVVLVCRGGDGDEGEGGVDDGYDGGVYKGDGVDVAVVVLAVAVGVMVLLVRRWRWSGSR
ncbi:hypothetical protein Tco_1179294, partial [Tanacetum coccineum]